MAQTLVIVESPTKATKIASFLGDGYIVESSRGHIRDLPTTAAEIPAKYKGEKWARTGINIDHDFEPLYVVAPDKRSTLKQLKEHLKGADELLLATDGDREGEAIAWHLMQELKPKVPAKRMVFHEITPEAILEAVDHPRQIDMDLVNAQETRRILDRLYGYEVSPVLWKKVRPRLSAGRVQSVATRLVVERERERMGFTTADYWDLTATLQPGSGERDFAARLTGVDGARVATGRDFDHDGTITSKNTVALDEPTAVKLAEALEPAEFSVTSVESKPYTRRPYAPFRTTTMQQEAGRKLGFSSDRTMRVAQKLYEGGHITYMRTDSVALSTTAINAARAQATQLYGADSVPAKPRLYASKVKNAQEAHEAIRPAGDTFRTPAQTGLTSDEFRLYELVWQRTLASQMVDAQGQTLSVKIEARPTGQVPLDGGAPIKVAQLSASGRTITNPGFLRAYVQAVDEDEAADDAQSRLPNLKQGQRLPAEKVVAEGHSTKPPSRYSEPTLIAKLEELEIGRPSTYSSIIATITARDYVFKRGTALVPTWLAFAVVRLLEQNFANLVDYKFTAGMEDILDQIARGDAKRLAVLDDFWFGDKDSPIHDEELSRHKGLAALVSALGDIDPRAISTFELGSDQLGEKSDIVLRLGKFGPYVEDAEGRRANVDEDLAPDELTVEKAKELLETPAGEERELGLDPQTHLPVVAKQGRFGPYVTEVLGEDVPKGAKPRTGSLLKSMSLETITLDQALQLLSLPRVVGEVDGEQITAQNGRYGPYLKKGTDSRSLTSEEQIFSITLDEALAIYAQPKTRGRAAAAPPLKELGNDPVSGQPVLVKDGRFGPYVTDGEYNATLRKDDSVEQVTLERAAELLAEKRAKKPARRTAAKKAPAKRAPAKKAPAKKAPAKKAPAKKTAAATTSTAAKKAPAKKAPAKSTARTSTTKTASGSTTDTSK